MNRNDYLTIGAATLTGAGAGYAIGAHKASKITKGVKKEVLDAVKSQKLGDYVNSRVQANMEKVHTLKKSKWEKVFTQIRQKATKDYNDVTALIKKASESKNRWVAGLAAVGLAIGACIAFAGKKAEE